MRTAAAAAALVSLSGMSLASRRVMQVLGMGSPAMLRRFSSAAGKHSSALVNGSWVEERLGKGKLKVFDATWILPAAHGPRNANEEFLHKRLPGAMRFDLDALADPNEKDLPHMLPPLNWFASKMDEIGVSPEDQIVVYDSLGQFSAARAFWTLYVLGGQNVKMLDGGLPKWIAEGRRTESGPPVKPAPNTPGTWLRLAQPRLDLVVSLKQVEEFANNALAGKKQSAQLVDARPKNRFLGEAPEPRPGLQRGAIPGSVSLPFKEILNEDGTFKSAQEIRQVFTKAGVDLSTREPIMTSCGSGTTAAILTFALQEILDVKAPLYDGSFAEWGKQDAKRPVVIST